MDQIETLIHDNEDNHLVVVLSFYDHTDKTELFLIPDEFAGTEIADISISKINLDKPLYLRAFNQMCDWLFEQLLSHPGAIFSFICSTDPLANRHEGLRPELYRWRLFEFFVKRAHQRLSSISIMSKDIVIGPDGYESYARVFYHSSQSAIIHLVATHLSNKYI